MRAIKCGHIVAFLGVALTATLSALVYAINHRDIQLARERSSLGSQIAETPCGQIEYGVIGDGPPLLFVHGAGGGYDQGLEFGKSLALTGFSIVAMSRFGYLRHGTTIGFSLLGRDTICATDGDPGGPRHAT
jgi:pimeloyl-ACP methyl ester carboxylesterase